MHERLPRTLFTRPVFVSADGVWSRPKRLLAGNVSHGGMFMRADAEMAPGTKVGISLEAKGKVFPFAEGEVVWCSDVETWSRKGRVPGFGVRFVRFLHPRSEKLLDFLLNRGAPELPPEIGNQVIGEPEPDADDAALASPSLPPSDFATIPIGDLSPPPPTGSDPAWSAAPIAAEPAPDEHGLNERPEETERNGRIATAVGLVTVLIVAGGAMLYLVHRNNERLAEAAGTAPAPVVEQAAAPAAPPPAPVEEAPAMPSPAPPQAQPEPEPRKAAPAPPPVKVHVVRLASGAVSSVSWQPESVGLNVALALAPGAQVERVFALSNPSRVVVDLKGPSPRVTHKEQANDATIATVRSGSREDGTRLVLDLKRPVASVEQRSSGLFLTLR